MLKWISEAFENARIAWSFPDYEKARREEHLAAAVRRFPTQKLEREIAELAQAPAREAALKFGPPAAALKAEIAADRERDRVLRQKLAVFERNYKKELDDLHLKLGEAKEALDELYEEKNEAHKAFNDAKSSIDHWYRMSNCYLGNRGREIPKSRIFGRSQNDLDQYKSEKSSAARTIERLREDIEDMKDDKVSHHAAGGGRNLQHHLGLQGPDPEPVDRLHPRDDRRSRRRDPPSPHRRLRGALSGAYRLPRRDRPLTGDDGDGAPFRHLGPQFRHPGIYAPHRRDGCGLPA